MWTYQHVARNKESTWPISSSMNLLLVFSWLFIPQKAKNCEKCSSQYPRTQSDVQPTVENPEAFHRKWQKKHQVFKKLEPVNTGIFFLKTITQQSSCGYYVSRNQDLTLSLRGKTLLHWLAIIFLWSVMIVCDMLAFSQWPCRRAHAAQSPAVPLTSPSGCPSLQVWRRSPTLWCQMSLHPPTPRRAARTAAALLLSAVGSARVPYLWRARRTSMWWSAAYATRLRWVIQSRWIRTQASLFQCISWSCSSTPKTPQIALFTVTGPVHLVLVYLW